MLWNNGPARVTGLVIAGAAMLAAPGGHGAASCWHTVPGPAVPARDSGGLSGVSMSGPASGWAVGSTLPNSPPDANFRPLLARWDGHRWQATRLPAGATRAGRLDAITALSASNAWAVGEMDHANSSAPLIIHWNGHQWARVRAAPVPGYTFTELLGVAAASPSDVWAVGEAQNAAMLRAVTEHWNGRTWTLVPSPSLGKLSGLVGVAVTSNHQAWAVGGSFARTSRPFVLHWTGHTWQRAATPRASTVELEGVAAVNPSQVWAVGFAEPGNRRLPYALRWNGHTWRSIPVPAGSSRNSHQLDSVTVLRGGHLAAAGENLGPTTFGDLHAQWNGRRWSVTTGPLNGTVLGAITTDGHNLWAVGSRDTSPSRFVPLVQTCHQ